MKSNLPTTDEQHWASFQQGDGKSYEFIYNKYFSSLYNYGRKYTTDTDLIEDIIHDLFLKLWKNRETLSSPVSVKNYLFKALRGQIFDKLAVEKRFLTKGDDDDENSKELLFGIHLSHETHLIDSEKSDELAQKLAKAMVHLTDRQKEAIFLRFYEEFSYPEVAEILNLTQKATYKLMARAISTLRESIEDLNVFLTMLFHKTDFLRFRSKK